MRPSLRLQKGSTFEADVRLDVARDAGDMHGALFEFLIGSGDAIVKVSTKRGGLRVNGATGAIDLSADQTATLKPGTQPYELRVTLRDGRTFALATGEADVVASRFRLGQSSR